MREDIRFGEQIGVDLSRFSDIMPSKQRLGNFSALNERLKKTRKFSIFCGEGSQKFYDHLLDYSLKLVKVGRNSMSEIIVLTESLDKADDNYQRDPYHKVRRTGEMLAKADRDCSAMLEISRQLINSLFNEQRLPLPPKPVKTQSEDGYY